MENFFQTVKNRYSIRQYQPRSIERDKLNTILDCIRIAPSAGNLQAFKIIIIENQEDRQALSRASFNQLHIAQAPLVLAFFQDQIRSMTKYGNRGKNLYSLQDATIACAYAQLGATALGLGSCWTGAFDENLVNQLVKAPEGMVPIALLSLGYPNEEPDPRKRRPLSNLVYWNSF